MGCSIRTRLTGLGSDIDGTIRSEARLVPLDQPDSLLDPDAIAQTYLHILRQPRNAWTWEVELHPWLENF